MRLDAARFKIYVYFFGRLYVKTFPLFVVYFMV